MEKTCIGIDVSKETIDICVLQSGSKQFFKIVNNTAYLAAFFKPYRKAEVLVAMENTGRYNAFLYEVLSDFTGKVYVINPLHLKRSMGLIRGKNDKIDSDRIAIFISKSHEDLRPWKPNDATISKIKELNTERRYRIKMKTGLKAQKADKAFLKGCLDKQMEKLNNSLEKLLEKQIKTIDEKIMALIKENQQLNETYQRIQTIPGVGKVLAVNMIIKTNGFTCIHSAREMACYAGVAPFDYSSGTSVRGRSRVSTLADKELKKILHLAALSVIRLKNDLATYYQRKVAEGKNKMLVLNAVRNKIIHRIYALIKNETYYKNELLMS